MPLPNLPGLFRIVHFQEAMAHAQTHRCRTIRIRAQCLLVERQRTTIILPIERNTCFTQQRRYIRWRLIQHEIELRIGLVHFVAFQQTKVCTAQQMVLIVHDNLVGRGVQVCGLHEQLALFLLGALTVGLLHIVGGQRVVGTHLIFLIFAIIQIALDSRRLQYFDEVICLILLVISDLEMPNGYNDDNNGCPTDVSMCVCNILTATFTQTLICERSWRRMPNTSSPSGNCSGSNSITWNTTNTQKLCYYGISMLPAADFFYLLYCSYIKCNVTPSLTSSVSRNGISIEPEDILSDVILLSLD